jgi:SAM-dependent methyltransferase
VLVADRLVVPRQLQRSVRKDEEFAIRSARAMLRDLASLLGLADLGDVSVLDVGCGVKFTQVLVNDELPIGRYVGIDVHEPLIEFLREHVADERFEYHHVDLRNDRYNPDGERMTAGTRLPVPEAAFDLICLFSVFTHLNPDDYVSMLTTLRRHVARDGHLVYSLYLDQLSEGGHGLMDAWSRKMGPRSVGKTVDFRDLTPGEPLKQALYTESYARALVEGTGWELERIIEPTEFVQHQFLCRPV